MRNWHTNVTARLILRKKRWVCETPARQKPIKVARAVIFFARHHCVNFGLLAPRNTWCGNAWFGEQVRSKYGTWCSGSLWCSLLDSLVIPCWRAPVRTKQLSTVTALLLSVLVVLVSRKVILFYVVSALQLCSYLVPTRDGNRLDVAAREGGTLVCNIGSRNSQVPSRVYKSQCRSVIFNIQVCLQLKLTDKLIP